MKTTSKPVTQLINGDIVYMHGGVFRVIENAHPAPMAQLVIGPSDCAAATAVCLSGSCGGYFWPGSNWTFQGNHHSRFAVENA